MRRRKPFSSGSKDDDRARLSELNAALDGLQDKLHTQRKQRVLLILQGSASLGGRILLFNLRVQRGDLLRELVDLAHILRDLGIEAGLL